MKKSFLSLLFLAAAITGCSQDPPPRRTYFILTSNYSFLFSGTSYGTEQVAFPYTVKPANGNTSDSTFASRPFHPLKDLQSAIYFTLEVGRNNHFFQFNIGGYTSAYNGTFLSLGYGRNIYVSLFQKISTRIPAEPNLLFKPSFHFFYNSFNNPIGTINNVNKYITIGSYASGPTFTISNADPRVFSTSSITYNTQTLSVEYVQRSFMVSPELSLGNNPYSHIFHWEVFASAFFSLTESIGIKFVQQASGDNSQSSGYYPIGTLGIQALYNGKSITESPYKFTALKIGFKIGVGTGKPKH